MKACGANLLLRSIKRPNRTRAVPRRSPNAHCIATSPLQCRWRSADRAGCGFWHGNLARRIMPLWEAGSPPRVPVRVDPGARLQVPGDCLLVFPFDR
jgi:hypothetical protein